MTEPKPAKKLRDYIPLHEYPGESSSRGPLLLLVLALFALAGIIFAIVAGQWRWLLVSSVLVAAIVTWSLIVNRKR